jgi:hypothetical protein
MAITNKNRLLEKYVQVVREDGLNTNKNVNIGIAGAGSTATLSIGTGGFSTTGSISASGVSNVLESPIETHVTTAAINATATATAAQVATGYITSTSAAGTTITLPTGTLLGAAIGATQGTVFDLYIDNTAGASTVTIAVATNGILSAAAVAGSSAGAGLLTVPSGVTGLACFRLMFSSATAYVFSRIA